jgi:hypothetical protein
MSCWIFVLSFEFELLLLALYPYRLLYERSLGLEGSFSIDVQRCIPYS